MTLNYLLDWFISFEQTLLFLGECIKHTLRQDFLRILMIKIDIEVIVSEVKSIIALVRLLKLQKQMTLGPLVLRFLKNTVEVILFTFT